MNDHHFNIKVAKDFDVDTAIFLNNMAFWINYLIANRNDPKQKNHYFESKYWLYNSYTDWSILFPYYSRKQMRRIIENCFNNGLIIKGNFNNKRYDKTNWYTMTEKALEYYPTLKEQILNTYAQTGKTYAQTGKTYAQTGTPIPYSNPDKNPDISFSPSPTATAKERQVDSLFSNDNVNADLDNRFEQFFESYPLKKNRPQCYKLFLKLKPADELLSTILADIKNRLENDSFWIDGFFPKPNNYLSEKTWLEPLFNREEIKTSIKKEKKQKIADDIKKRIAEQEAYSEKERQRLLEKQKNIQEDIESAKKIKSEIKERIKSDAASIGISQLRSCLGM